LYLTIIVQNVYVLELKKGTVGDGAILSTFDDIMDRREREHGRNIRL